jgi:hypothetical protein
MKLLSNFLTLFCTLHLFSGGAFAETLRWDVTEKPPHLVNPVLVDVSETKARKIPPRDIHCGGFVYRIKVPVDADAIVFMSGPDALQYPVHITGGQNVRIVGLQIELITQPGCEIAALPNRPASKHPNANIHPRVPGGMALRLQQYETSFVEGAFIDVRGHQADCIVIRNPDKLDNVKAQEQRDVVVQNTACRGVEGMGQSDIGDGVHGDLFQNQGQDLMRRVVFENVSHRTSQEGIVIHGTSDFPGTKSLLIRRFDYSWDSRYVGDDDYEKFGLAFAGWTGPDWVLEDVRIDDYRDDGDYLIINGQRYGEQTERNILRHPEIRSKLPENGAFALPERTGLRYVSPHGNTPRSNR